MNDTIFDVISLNRNQVKWQEYLYSLTPVQKINKMYFKRQDKFAPLGYGGVNGSKLRQAIWLVTQYMKEKNPVGLIGGTSVRSPQLSMSSAICKHFGLQNRLIIGAAKQDTCMKHYNVQLATWFGAKFYLTKVGYNPALKKKISQLLDTQEFKDYYYLEYGITVDHKIHPKEQIQMFHRVGSEQVKNIPDHITTLVLPTGSTNSTISILYGIARFKPKNLKTVLMVGLGPQKLSYIQERLDIISQVSGIETKLYTRYYPDHISFQDEHNSIVNNQNYHYDLHFFDCIKRKLFTYDKQVKTTYQDITFHPTYQAKAFKYFKQNYPELQNENTLFWIVGSKPTFEPMYQTCKSLLGEKPEKVNLFGNDLNDQRIIQREKKNSLKGKKEKVQKIKPQKRAKSKKSKIVENQVLGRWSELNNEEESDDLKPGLDFRNPKYRREVFLRFYGFHLKYKSHPGGVYFAFPYIQKYYNLDRQTMLWLAFINGCSQNIVSTWIIWLHFPDINKLDLNQLETWFNQNQHHFKVGSGWDLDRKYYKVGRTGFPACVKSYKQNVDKHGSQCKMFDSVMNTQDPYKNFQNLWEFVRTNFLSFGRLSTFSYLEYLKIIGQNLDCNNLFLEDRQGSKSHRNGLCKVLGRDQLDWWDAKDSTNPNFPGYDDKTIEWLKGQADLLLEQAVNRFKNDKSIPQHDINRFTLQSTLCCYKSWHRPNRRYPNIYMDMMYDRIKYAQDEWGNKFQIFWDMRKQILPEHLRLEDNPQDPGLNKIKQNHYRLTGQVIMMDQQFECFSNDFNKKFSK